MACCFKSCFSLIFLLLGIFTLFVIELTPNAPLYRDKPGRPFHGPLTRNNILDSTEKLFEGKLEGPEAIAIKDGKLYTGLRDGRIVEIDGNNLRTIVKIGKSDCESDNSCPQILGLRFDSKGTLFVADVIKGIYKINVKSGEVTSLVPGSTIVDGRKIEFADDLIVTKTGDIYFTDAGQHYHVWELFYKYLAAGRILHYDPKTKKVTTVLDKLYFPNGIELSRDEDFLIFTQTLESNILKYYLKGPKKGFVEILVDNLPGAPDNIRVNSRGNYWVAILMPKVPEDPSLWERVKCHFTRYIIYSSLQLAQNVVGLTRKYVPLDVLNVVHDSIENFIFNSIYHAETYGLVIEVSSNGEIVRSLHSPKGAVHLITHAIEHENSLYLGSIWNSYIGKLKLN